MAPRGSIAVSWPMSNFSSSGNVTGVVGSMEFLATSLPTIRNDIISAVVLSGFIFASHAGGSLAGEANANSHVQIPSGHQHQCRSKSAASVVAVN